MGATPSTSMPNGVFLVCIALYGLVVGSFYLSSIRQGHPWRAVLAALLVSIIPIAFLAQAMEHRSLVGLAEHFQQQSFAFIFGDLVALPFSSAMATAASCWLAAQLGDQLVVDGHLGRSRRTGGGLVPVRQ